MVYILVCSCDSRAYDYFRVDFVGYGSLVDEVYL